jgi:NAD(P)H-dependent FMN reductase
MSVTIAAIAGSLRASSHSRALLTAIPAAGLRRAGRQARRHDQRQPRPRGGARALADLRKVLTVIGADLTATGLAVPQAHAQLTPGGRIADPALRDRITALISDLTQHATAASPALAA